MTAQDRRRSGEFTADYQRQKARRDYESGLATIKIDPKRSALIVVDMIEEFTTPGLTPFWVPEATKMLPTVGSLIEACRKVGSPVIYTYYMFNPTNTDMNPWFREAWAPIDKIDGYEGPPLFTKESVDRAIKPDYGRDILIAKPSYGAFTNTSLDYILKNLGVDTAIVCGTMTNFCCGTTAREAQRERLQGGLRFRLQRHRRSSHPGCRTEDIEEGVCPRPLDGRDSRLAQWGGAVRRYEDRRRPGEVGRPSAVGSPGGTPMPERTFVMVPFAGTDRLLRGPTGLRRRQ